MRNNNVFDRSVAFTFYKEWKEDADTIEEDFGAEGKAKFYDAIINYALFEVEPEMKAPIKYFWNTIKEKIDASQKNRSKGFREDTGMTQKVIDYKQQNPEASVRDVAKAVGCSIGKVSKSLNSTPISTSTTITTPTSTTTSTTTNTTTNTTMNVNSVNSVNTITDDIKLAIIDMFKAKNKYKDIQAKIKTDFNTNISFDDIKQVIDNKSSYIALAEKEKETKTKNYFRQVEYDYIPNVIDKLATYGIITSYDEVKTAYDEVQDSNLCSKWSVRDLVSNCYLNPSFIGDTKGLKEYANKIVRSMDETKCYFF